MDEDLRAKVMDGCLQKTIITAGSVLVILAVSVKAGNYLDSKMQEKDNVPAIHNLDSCYYIKNSHTPQERSAYRSQRNLLWEQYKHDAGKRHF